MLAESTRFSDKATKPLGGFGAFSTPSRQHRCLQLGDDQFCLVHICSVPYAVLSLHLWLHAHFPFSSCIGFQGPLFCSMIYPVCAGAPDLDERLVDIMPGLISSICLNVVASAERCQGNS